MDSTESGQDEWFSTEESPGDILPDQFVEESSKRSGQNISVKANLNQDNSWVHNQNVSFKHTIPGLEALRDILLKSIEEQKNEIIRLQRSASRFNK